MREHLSCPEPCFEGSPPKINPLVGRSVAVSGTMTPGGTLQARVMWRAKGRGSWGKDIRE
ncbi:MAG: hypothetical protein ACM3SQ_01950 [Betaproteobacteria bacterium]